jgi:porin
MFRAGQCLASVGLLACMVGAVGPSATVKAQEPAAENMPEPSGVPAADFALRFHVFQPDEPVAEAGQPAEDARGADSFFHEHCFDKWLSGDWGGYRTKWEEKGIKFSFILTTGYFQNLRGGIETHNANAFSGDWRMNLLIDLDELGVIPGAFFFVRGKSSWNNGITNDIGALSPEQFVYGTSGDEEFFIDKWWYGQRLWDDRVEFRIGKLLTLADLFDIPAYAKLPWDQFSNAALNRNPTVPHRKAPGFYLKVSFCDWAHLRMGAIDADQTDATLPYDVERAYHGPANYIGLWELVLSPKLEGPKGRLPGDYAFGLWYDGRTKRIFRDEMGGLRAPRFRNDDTGFYLAFDQLVLKENEDPADQQGLGAFARYGFAHPETNRVEQFWSIGAQYQGLFEGRDADVLAFGVGQSIMSKTFRHHIDSRADRETVYELYYAYQLTCACIITPDLQIITNPGGGKDARDSIVAGVRVRLAF